MNTDSKFPYVFDEFFASGMEESISPFLTKTSRKFGKNLSIKSSVIAAFFLGLAWILSSIDITFSYLSLSIVYFLAGTPAFINAIEDLRSFNINIDVLMTLAAFFAVIIGSPLEGGLLLVLFEISGTIEEMVTSKTKSALQSLNKISPKTGWVIDPDGYLYEKSIKEIEIGTHLLIKAGEIIPLDGNVISGKSYVNMVHLTGESVPVSKMVGMGVQAGGLNLDGTLTIEVTRNNRDSTLHKIVELITQASEAKPKLERFVDRFGKWYSIIIIGLTVFFSVALPFFFSLEFLGEEGSLYRALTFLIAASPCALVLATPTAYLSAISSCAKRGILLKGGVILDALKGCNAIAFDKTGTLTTGKLTLEKFETLFTGKIPCTEDTAVSIAASIEKHAVHPIAEAICEYASWKNSLLFSIEDFLSLPGSGVQGKVILNNEKVDLFIGQSDFIQSKISFPLPKLDTIHTFFLVGDNLFVFHFIDRLRDETVSAIETLRKRFHLIMLTGDHEKKAREVADTLKIPEWYAGLKPEDKLDKISQFSKSRNLAMIGDGVNDAPALARATVGISMGKIGSATAIEASDIVFLHDDLSLLEWVIEKAHKTTEIVRQNLFLALGVILFVTTPALLGIVPLWVAVILHEGGTVLVGVNSLRLLKSRKKN